MNKPLLIGQAPGPNTDPDLPLYPLPSTSAGGRLCAMMGLSRVQYFTLLDRMNLLAFFPGRHKRDDKFPVRDARIIAQSVRQLLKGRTVVMVGRCVAEAFDLPKQPFFEWCEIQVGRRLPMSSRNVMVRTVIVPHPSGRNHWYNNPENRRRVSLFWEEFRKNELGVTN